MKGWHFSLYIFKNHWMQLLDMQQMTLTLIKKLATSCSAQGSFTLQVWYIHWSLNGVEKFNSLFKARQPKAMNGIMFKLFVVFYAKTSNVHFQLNPTSVLTHIIPHINLNYVYNTFRCKITWPVINHTAHFNPKL